MHELLKRSGRWLSVGWFWPLALLALPNCALPVGGIGPDVQFDPGPEPRTSAIMCDIPQVPTTVPNCASPTDIGYGISFAHAAVALAICERDGHAKVWWRLSRHYPHVWDEAQQLLATLGLQSVMEQPTRQLAYGRQRLLEIALALAMKPRILLLDEPAAGVPEGESDEVFDVIASLPDDLSVVFVEHDMDLVFRFAQRIAVLVAGSVLTEGTPLEIANDARVREVYLGSTHVQAA